MYLRLVKLFGIVIIVSALSACYKPPAPAEITMGPQASVS